MRKNLFVQLALLTDQEAEDSLNIMLRGFMATRPEYDELFSSPDLLVECGRRSSLFALFHLRRAVTKGRLGR
jgi:hypothetical protein